MKLPIKIFADFNNADTLGRVRLNTRGALGDIEANKIVLQDDMHVLLDDDEGFTTTGVIEFSKEENIWVAQIDWDTLK
jgi:hypothetical protein